MSTATLTRWSFEADYLQGCNCDYGCPCEFSARPTAGFCAGVIIYRITRGRFDEVPLDGLGLAVIVHWPGAIHEGNGTARVLVDERANPAQREALLTITSGAAGGMPFEIVATTLTTVLEPLFVPFEVHLDGRNSRARVGDVIHLDLAPIRNPVTGDPESVRLEHATGFIFKDAECVSADELRVSGGGPLNFACRGKAGFVTKIRYSNHAA